MENTIPSPPDTLNELWLTRTPAQTKATNRPKINLVNKDKPFYKFKLNFLDLRKFLKSCIEILKKQKAKIKFINTNHKIRVQIAFFTT